MSDIGGAPNASDIRAFVGHSFVDGDAQVVRKFLDYFTQLSKSRSGFSWEHAQQAEPRILAEKVLSLIADKNVFIGICTRKERVVLDGKLSRKVFYSERRWAREQDIGWKTSDWVIQEIGLAVGKGLDIILLLEKGVREPGGLQGGLEYIEFDREHPEGAFGKLLEMISSLAPKTAAPTTSLLVKPVVPDEQREHEASVDDTSITTPTPSWKRRNYQFAYFHFVLSDDTAGMDRISRTYLERELANDSDNKAAWEAFCEYTRLRYGHGGKLTELQALAGKNPQNSKVLEHLALGYDYFQNFAEAARTYRDAVLVASDEASRLDLLGQAALEEAKAGATDRAATVIGQMKLISDTDARIEVHVLETLRQVADLAKDEQAVLGTLERLAEVKPGDIGIMFSLAYKHSECGNADVALLHYLRIPEHERDSATWNNLGVAFGERALPGKSVTALRESKSMGETLAMSNLANRFINGGFLAEAQTECDEGLKSPDYHKNISHSLVKLKEVPTEEETKLDEMLKKAKPVSDFYRMFGKALAARELSNLPNLLSDPDCVLMVQLTGSSFSAVGSYDRSHGALTNALLGFGGSATPGRMRVEYSGTLRGRAIDGLVRRTREGEATTPPSLLGSFNDEKRVLMMLAGDASEIQVMEIQQGNVAPRFYALTRTVGA